MNPLNENPGTDVPPVSAACGFADQKGCDRDGRNRDFASRSIEFASRPHEIASRPHEIASRPHEFASRSRKRPIFQVGTPPAGPGSARDLAELRASLRANFLHECRELYGLDDGPWIDRATQNWFDDSSNYDRRWRVIDARRPGTGRIFDMASGCGTFLLHGLNRGRDVFGIEPEPWKRQYFRRKVELSGYPRSFLSRLVPAAGEQLPFADESFDLVTTFQTLEHVADVGKCIDEMLRVLRPGGVLYLRAPDYNCFFEPHYRVPFLPRMHRPLAERYLERLRRPAAGLRMLNWTTEQGILKLLHDQRCPVKIERNRHFFIEQRRREVDGSLPPLLRRLGMGRLLNETHQIKRKLGAWVRIGRQERVIDLWISKIRTGE